MKRTLARIATAAVTIPFATAFVAGAAHAQPVTVTVPGCWGGGTNDTIVCDLTLSVQGPAPTTYPLYVKVCAGTCQDVPVPMVNPGTDTTEVCYSYRDGWGASHSDCEGADIWINTGPLLDLLDCSRQTVCAHE